MKRFWLIDEIYALHKIFQIIIENNKFLSNRLNIEEIYDKIKNIESIYQHDFENKRDQLKKIKRGKLEYSFDSISVNKKNEISKTKS